MIMIKKMKKAIAIGFGYKNWNGKKFTKRYEYPILTEAHLKIVMSVGGEYKLITK